MLEWFATSIFQSQWKPFIKSQVELVVINCPLEVCCIMEWTTAEGWLVTVSVVPLLFPFRLYKCSLEFQLTIQNCVSGIHSQQGWEQELTALKLSGRVVKKINVQFQSGDLQSFLYFPCVNFLWCWYFRKSESLSFTDGWVLWRFWMPQEKDSWEFWGTGRDLHWWPLCTTECFSSALFYSYLFSSSKLGVCITM